MFWRFDEQRERFASLAPTVLAEHPNCRIFLHANVTGLNASADANALRTITARSLSGRAIEVQATTFVLASGAV